MNERLPNYDNWLQTPPEELEDFPKEDFGDDDSEEE